jgi:transposase-like protein
VIRTRGTEAFDFVPLARCRNDRAPALLREKDGLDADAARRTVHEHCRTRRGLPCHEEQSIRDVHWHLHVVNDFPWHASARRQWLFHLEAPVPVFKRVHRVRAVVRLLATVDPARDRIASMLVFSAFSAGLGYFFHGLLARDAR